VKHKTRKKHEYLALPNSYNLNPELGGRWAHVFGRQAPLVIEVGAGRCDFALTYAKRFPQHDVVAIDLRPERLWAGAKRALEAQLHNLRFLRMRVEAELHRAFAPGEISTCWITYPDPWPKDRHEKHRLTGRCFLADYQRLLAPDGNVQLKTDNRGLYDWTLAELAAYPGATVLAQTDDLAHSPLLDAETGISTWFERKWAAEGDLSIHYLKWGYAAGGLSGVTSPSPPGEGAGGVRPTSVK